MSEEKKQLSLSDLGIEKEETPAEKAEKENTKTDKVIHTSEGDVQSIKPTANVEEHIKTEKKEKKFIPTPNNTSPKVTQTIINENGEKVEKPVTHHKPVSGYEGFREVKDVNEIAKVPLKPKEDPIKKTMNGLYELADKGIERTEKELTKPGGRIDYAKHEYVKNKYAQLVSRSKSNKSLAKKIKALNDFMDTDARFDGISDYERQGYIIFKIARDDTVETNDDYFGVKNDQKAPRFRNSHDAAIEIEKVTSDKENDTEDFYDDSKTAVLSDADPMIPFKEDDKKEEEKEDDSLTLEEDATSDAELLSDDDSEVKDNTAEIDPSVIEESDPIDDDDDDIELSDDQQKKILNNLKTGIVSNLGLEKVHSVDGFTIANKAIKLNNALEGNGFKPSVTWGLQFSGTAIEMTPLSGEELIMLSPQQTKYDTVAGLRTVFSIIWRHIVNRNKPAFDVWLKQISDYDVDCLLFGVYVANFKDTNVITYECPNKKCKNAFVKKFPIEDMIIYPDNKVKEKFQKILRKDTEGTSLYKTHPIAINDNYAIGFITQSVYSNLFEPASLSEDFSKKYKPIIDIMPNIDTVYKIDSINRTLVPISFGKSDTLQKTVMRKVKALLQIMKRFTPDERAIVISEASKIAVNFNNERIRYRRPETVCPVCGEKIPEEVVTPLDLLFTRAQLPIIAASIQE